MQSCAGTCEERKQNFILALLGLLYTFRLIQVKAGCESEVCSSSAWPSVQTGPLLRNVQNADGGFEGTTLIEGFVTVLPIRFKILLSIKIRLAILGSCRAKMNAASLISSHDKSLDINS